MKPPYLLEKSLPGRIKNYLKNHDNNDINELTDYLMENYSDFSRKKRSQFMASVRKALDYELYLHGHPHQLQRFDITCSAEDEIQEIPCIRSSLNSGLSAMYKKNVSTKQDVDEPVIVLEPKETQKRAKNTTPNDVSSSALRKKRPLDSHGMNSERKLRRHKSSFVVTKPTVDVHELAYVHQGVETLCSSITTLLCCMMHPCEESIDLKSALVTGPTGSGKSSLIEAIAGTAECSLVRVSAIDLTGGLPGNSDQLLQEAFDLAVSSSPSVLHIDKIDKLSQKSSSLTKGLEQRICSKLTMCIKELTTNHGDKQVIVLAESTYPESIDLDLKETFQIELSIPTLDNNSRMQILRSLTTNNVKNIDFALLAKHTVSYVAGDLKKLVNVARMEMLKSSSHKCSHGNEPSTTLSCGKSLRADLASYCSRSKDLPKLTTEHFLNALRRVVPVLKRQGFPSVPEVTWDDIGGLAKVKQVLIEEFIEPIEYPELYKGFGDRPDGILLWGPPGCGKTLLAKAVANQAGMNFYPIAGPEILDKYQGESERAIREIFERASRAAPCVIFFDEFDSICRSRERASSESGSKSTIVNTLLAEMDGTRRREGVHVMCATNLPHILDPAVTRPGRIGTKIFVGKPDSLERELILKACTKNGTCPKLTADVNLADVAKRCEDFSGADCSELIRVAWKLSIKEIIHSPHMVDKPDPDEVFMRHIEGAFKQVKPSVTSNEGPRDFDRPKKKLGSKRRLSQHRMRRAVSPPTPQPL